jgi:formate-dependent nitrite reductase cytochrome c552 subunit
MTELRSTRRLVLYAAAAAAGAAALVTALLVNIVERKQEARNAFFRVVELTDETEDPATWGKNFPLQYDGYRRTVDQVRTRYGGSESSPRTPTQADPRSIVPQSRLGEDPRLKTMWAGYAFATDFREERGHASMLDDQTYTERQHVAKQPGTCMHCHASVYLPYKKLGAWRFDSRVRADEPDVHPEFEMWNQGIQARSGVTCADCHMPYQREGALKISDHHVRSPVLNVNRACQTCHRWSEDELRQRVFTIQDRTYQVRNLAMDALVGAHRRHQVGTRRRHDGRSAGHRPRRAATGAGPARFHRS